MFYLLEAEGFECWLLNASHVKNVPGRPKTDKLDAVWLAKVVERGMCAPSFVPPQPIRGTIRTAQSRQAQCYPEAVDCGQVKYEPWSVEAPKGGTSRNGGNSRFPDLSAAGVRYRRR